jgi:hypothetical protein
MAHRRFGASASLSDLSDISGIRKIKKVKTEFNKNIK